MSGTRRRIKIVSESESAESDDDEFTEQTSSQKSSKQSQSLCSEDLDELAAKCANFFLVANSKKIPIKRTDFAKVLPKGHSKKTNDIISAASLKLEKVFGYKVVELEKKGLFLLVNLLNISEIMKNASPFAIQSRDSSILVLRTKILMIIFMNGGIIREGTLIDFIKKFGVDITSKENHPMLGNVQRLVYQDFVRQGYLEVHHHKEVDPSYMEIQWGSRAHKEVDKGDLLQFVCKVYGDNIRPAMWVEQWQAVNREKGSNTSSQTTS